MPKISNSWKQLERTIAEKLKGKRVLRGADFSVGGVDVEVADFPGLKIDAKYRAAWAHSSYLKEVADKYVKEPGEMAVLITKQKRERGEIVCMYLDDFATMLDADRELRRQLRSVHEMLRKAQRDANDFAIEAGRQKQEPSGLHWLAGLRCEHLCSGVCSVCARLAGDRHPSTRIVHRVLAPEPATVAQPESMVSAPSSPCTAPANPSMDHCPSVGSEDGSNAPTFSPFHPLFSFPTKEKSNSGKSGT